MKKCILVLASLLGLAGVSMSSNVMTVNALGISRTINIVKDDNPSGGGDSSFVLADFLPKDQWVDTGLTCNVMMPSGYACDNQKERYKLLVKTGKDIISIQDELSENTIYNFNGYKVSRLAIYNEINHTMYNLRKGDEVVESTFTNDIGFKIKSLDLFVSNINYSYYNNVKYDYPIYNGLTSHYARINYKNGKKIQCIYTTKVFDVTSYLFSYWEKDELHFDTAMYKDGKWSNKYIVSSSSSNMESDQYNGSVSSSVFEFNTTYENLNFERTCSWNSFTSQICLIVD